LGAATALGAAPKKPAIRFGFTTYTWGKEWDIPTLIANCEKAKAFGTELRTSGGYAHGVELTTPAERRREVKKMFEAGPVKLVGLATGERFDVPDPAKVKAAIEAAKGFLQLSADVGSTGIRVFPNDYHKEVPREKTIAQIADALNAVGAAAADLGQEVRLEAHGSAGDLESIAAIMARVTSPAVRVKLNSAARDAQGKGFEANFNLVKKYLGHTVHVHDFKDPEFPNQLQITLLARMGWDGWLLLEASSKVEDRVKAIAEQRELCEKMIAQAMKER
jgi:sugar phosphate isomerase/epimerase